MGVNQKPDGQVKVGLGYSDLNEYKGYAGRREIVIQLTSDGATQDSLDALEFLKSYALYHNSVGEPIFPASTNVFISNNGVTKAVEADEVTVDGDNVNIGGCVWNGENWDFTNAGQGGGSSLPAVTSADNGKVLTVKDGAWAAIGKDIDLTPIENTRIQPIPVLFNPYPGPEEFDLSTELTPKDILTGYTLTYTDDEEVQRTLTIPPESASSYAVAYIYTSGHGWQYGVRVSLLLADNAANDDGTILQSGVFDLSGLGISDTYGYLVLEPSQGYDIPYRCRIVYWSASIM